MLTKKQFISVLMSGVIVFIIVFAVCYACFYKAGIEQPIIQEDAVEAVMQEELLATEEVLPIIKAPTRIAPTTKVKIELMSEEHIIDTQILDTNTVMGMSQAEIESYLSAYEVALFSEEEVILQKQIPKQTLVPSYVLGVESGIVGIVETDNSSQFIALNMELREFSKIAAEMIASGQIPVTALEKQKLQRNPYYIEVILQNHYEE